MASLSRALLGIPCTPSLVVVTSLTLLHRSPSLTRVDIEGSRILVDHVWDALELWVRGVFDDGNDLSSNQLSVRKALTCLEGLVVQSHNRWTLPSLVPSCIKKVVCYPTTARPLS